MLDPAARAHFGPMYDVRRRHGGPDLRCPICHCLPSSLYTHRVRPGLDYQYLTTCDSHYCRSRDVPS